MSAGVIFVAPTIAFAAYGLNSAGEAASLNSNSLAASDMANLSTVAVFGVVWAVLSALSLWFYSKMPVVDALQKSVGDAQIANIDNMEQGLGTEQDSCNSSSLSLRAVLQDVSSACGIVWNRRALFWRLIL